MRTAARGWVTRSCMKLEDLCRKDTVDVYAVKEALDEFNERLSNLDSAQSAVELAIEEENLMPTLRLLMCSGRKQQRVDLLL